jgi:hypothetical protein
LLTELKRLSILRSANGSGEGRVADAVKKLDAMRKALSEEPSEGSTEGHMQNWAELCELAKGFDTSSSLDIKFVWVDSWQGSGLPLLQSRARHANLRLPRCFSMVRHSRCLHGAVTRKKNYGGVHEREKELSAAVSVSIKDIQQEVSTDISDTALEMLKMLSLAHVQRSFLDAGI